MKYACEVNHSQRQLTWPPRLSVALCQSYSYQNNNVPRPLWETHTHTHTHTLVHVSFPHSVSSGLRAIPIAVVTVHNSGPSASISSDYGAIPRLATFPPATPALPRQVTPRRQGQSPCEAAIYYSSDVPPRDQIQPVSDR